MNNKETFTGCLIDNRPQYEKDKDYQATELFAMGDVYWQEREPVSYPIRDQKTSSSCVAQTLALMMSILNLKEEGRWVDMSASFIYQLRSNKGYGGMMGNDALEIARKMGTTLEVLMPSQNMSEKEINAVPMLPADSIISKIFAIDKYYHLPFNIDRIASVVEQGLPVMIWFQFPRAEWNSEPKITNSDYDIVHHSVTVVDYILRKGKKYLVVQDSWGFHSSTDKGLRYISEDYLKRTTFCAYLLDKPNAEEPITKPSVKLTKTLRRGVKDKQVVDLQKVLVYEGFLPRQTNSTDGIFGAATESAVKELQRKYYLDVDGIVGPKSRTLINNIYS